MSATKGKKTQQRSAIADVVAREYTIHMHKRVRFFQADRELWGGSEEVMGGFSLTDVFNVAPRLQLQEPGSQGHQGDPQVRPAADGTMRQLDPRRGPFSLEERRY